MLTNKQQQAFVEITVQIILFCLNCFSLSHAYHVRTHWGGFQIWNYRYCRQITTRTHSRDDWKRKNSFNRQFITSFNQSQIINNLFNSCMWNHEVHDQENKMPFCQGCVIQLSNGPSSQLHLDWKSIWKNIQLSPAHYSLITRLCGFQLSIKIWHKTPQTTRHVTQTFSLYRPIEHQ